MGHSDRVSVLPLTLEEAAFLPTYDLVLGHHVQLESDGRMSFWLALADRLQPTSVAVFDDHFGASGVDEVPRKMSAIGTTGDYTVRRWFSAVPLSADERAVTNEYEIVATDDTVVYSDTVTHTQQVQDRDEGIRPVESCSLKVVDFADNWLMITR